MKAYEDFVPKIRNHTVRPVLHRYQERLLIYFIQCLNSYKLWLAFFADKGRAICKNDTKRDCEIRRMFVHCFVALDKLQYKALIRWGKKEIKSMIISILCSSTVMFNVNYLAEFHDLFSVGGRLDFRF
jgi:hypothetical protein